jgi:SAM-dependent methyltransferase
MDTPDLSQASDLDFAALELDYEGFRALARNPHLDVHGRIGFPTAYREGFEPAILADIARKLPMLLETEGGLVLDVGPGCANLPRMIIDLCAQRRHRIILADSEEMLAQLPDVEGVTVKVSGAFPAVRQKLSEAAPEGVDALICYSVLHYIYAEGNPFEAIDAAVGLLAPGGRALFGDIPNNAKRRRFFASAAGKAFHRAYTGRDEDPVAGFNAPAPGRIDDAVLAGLVQRAQLAGCDAYVLPQPPDLPMANRRDDLLIARP